MIFSIVAKVTVVELVFKQLRDIHYQRHQVEDRNIRD